MGVAQLVEPWIVIPVVAGSSPVTHPTCAKVAELVDALDLGSSGATRESSSLSFRTIPFAIYAELRCATYHRHVMSSLGNQAGGYPWLLCHQSF